MEIAQLPCNVIQCLSTLTVKNSYVHTEFLSLPFVLSLYISRKNLTPSTLEVTEKSN